MHMSTSITFGNSTAANHFQRGAVMTRESCRSLVSSSVAAGCLLRLLTSKGLGSALAATSVLVPDAAPASSAPRHGWLERNHAGAAVAARNGIGEGEGVFSCERRRGDAAKNPRSQSDSNTT